MWWNFPNKDLTHTHITFFFLMYNSIRTYTLIHVLKHISRITWSKFWIITRTQIMCFSSFSSFSSFLKRVINQKWWQWILFNKQKKWGKWEENCVLFSMFITMEEKYVLYIQIKIHISAKCTIQLYFFCNGNHGGLLLNKKKDSILVTDYKYIIDSFV